MAAPKPLTNAQQISFKELKEEVLMWWEVFADTMRIVTKVEDAKTEMRQKFGDLRCRRTWELAYSYYLVQEWANSYCYQGYQILTDLMNPTEEPEWSANLIEDRLNFLLEHSGGLYMIRVGLEQLLKYNDPEDWAASQPFFDMVRQRQGSVADAVDYTLKLRSAALAGNSPSRQTALPISA